MGLPMLPQVLSALVASVLFSTSAIALPDLGTVLSRNKNITTYTSLIKKYPDILLQLPNYSGVTIVAPSDEAFKKYQGWSNDNETLVTNILEYHILQGTVSTAKVPQGPATFFPTLLKDSSYTNVTSGQNIVVYKQPGDDIIFGSGSGSRSTVVQPDIAFTGGMVQVVDTILVPPARVERTARDAYPRDLTAFLGALYDAGLVSQFADSANVTIFAPSNAAFQRVGPALTRLDKLSLARILQYHLVPHAVMPSPTLSNGTNLTTVANVPLHVTRAGNNLYVDSAQVVQPDILVANGVIHIIGDVLSPDAPALRPNPVLGTQPPAFAVNGTVTATGVNAPTPFTSALPCTSDCPTPTTADGGTAGSTSTGTARSRSSGSGAGPTACPGLGTGMLGVLGAAAAMPAAVAAWGVVI